MKTLFKSTWSKIILACFCLLLAVLVTTFGAPATSAAPPAVAIGALPLYDSGFVLTTTSDQTFNHRLHAIPALWSITCGSGSMGSNPTASPTYFGWGGYDYGHLVVGLHPDDFEVRWYADGIAYNKRVGWFQAGEDYCRLRIYAAD